MIERVLERGFVQSVRYSITDGCITPERAIGGITIAGCTFEVPAAEADKALAAMRSTPTREIEIVHGEDAGTWRTRTVRIVPVVTVEARGAVVVIRVFKDGSALVEVLGDNRAWHVSSGSRMVAAKSVYDADEVEIVSVDGGPVTVRRAS